MTQDSSKGAAIYSPLVLKLYDWWVLGVSNRHAWQCSTRAVLLPFFRQHAGRHHLDVGAGTGYYPANAALPASTRMTLLDLNAASLDAAQRRLPASVAGLCTRWSSKAATRRSSACRESACTAGLTDRCRVLRACQTRSADASVNGSHRFTPCSRRFSRARVPPDGPMRHSSLSSAGVSQACPRSKSPRSSP